MVLKTSNFTTHQRIHFCNVLKGTAILKASVSEIKALIKSCNPLQTQSKSNEKLESYRCLYSREFKAMDGSSS